MRIGIDLGGSKIAGVVLQNDALVCEQRVSTPSGDYAGTLRAIADLVARMESAVGVHGLPVGMGHPGSIDTSSGLLRNANSTCLNGRALKQDIQAELQREVAMANDANCLAMSEQHNGAASQCESAFCVILGTGVGGALLHRGHTLNGHNALAGEWGHNPLPWKTAEDGGNRRCWCGQQNCIEAWLSGPGMAQSFEQQFRTQQDAAAVADAAQKGDDDAKQCLQTYSHQLARALASVINLYDPQRIVLAGGLSQIDDLYHDVPRLWQRWVFADQVSTELVPAQHGDASGVLGAARLGMTD